MEYLFQTTPRNFEDFASGRVLHNARGTTAFPVRLASEIIQRCFDLLERKGHEGPYTLYDPCCGGAYLLTTIGLLHGNQISRIFASDVQAEVLGLAEKNLALLTASGLENRKKQIAEWLQLYRKPSHLEALHSAERLAEFMPKSRIEETLCFCSDITRKGDLHESLKNINILITDLPYGNLVDWRSESKSPLADFFDQAYRILDPKCSILAVVSDKNQKLKHDKFRRKQHLKVGKRKIGIFEPVQR